jgi:predicted RNase H-like nuclease (RuvC/YqgF family)
MCSFFVF